MSAVESQDRPAARGRGAFRVVSGILFFLLAVGRGIFLERELLGRRAAADLLGRCGLEERAEIVGTLPILETADLASAFAAQACLARLAPLGAGAAAQFGPEAVSALGSVQARAAAGVQARPGSSLTRLLLGEAGHALWDLESRPAPDAARKWLRTFALAQAAAPGFDLVSTGAADAVLGAWPRLSEGDRVAARELLRRAWLSPAYVRNSLGAAWTVVGPDAAAWLPDAPGSLAEAAGALRSIGQSAAADALDRRRRGLSPESR